MITLFLAASLICFDGACYPALAGKSTPVGTFTLERAAAPEHPYGGSILVYQWSGREAYAIHRPFNDERRRLLANRSRARVTAGCINVDDSTYDAIVRSGIQQLRVEL